MTSENILVYSDHLTIRFPQSVASSALTNEKFRLFTDIATPVEITDPWLPINVANDYESISRTLTLYYKTNLADSTPYLLITTNLRDPANRLIPQATYDFTTNATTTGLSSVPTPEPTYVQDFSIVPDVFSAGNLIVGATPGIFVTEIVPADALIDSAENDGRITIKFSAAPDGNFINSTYFKVQRKAFSAGASTRWQIVDTQTSIDGSRPWVYVDIPSTDATPVYNLSDHTYFETGYKYRLKISKDIGRS